MDRPQPWWPKELTDEWYDLNNWVVTTDSPKNPERQRRMRQISAEANSSYSTMDAVRANKARIEQQKLLQQQQQQQQQQQRDAAFLEAARAAEQRSNLALQQQQQDRRVAAEAAASRARATAATAATEQQQRDARFLEEARAAEQRSNLALQQARAAQERADVFRYAPSPGDETATVRGDYIIVPEGEAQSPAGRAAQAWNESMRSLGDPTDLRQDPTVLDTPYEEVRTPVSGIQPFGQGLAPWTGVPFAAQQYQAQGQRALTKEEYDRRIAAQRAAAQREHAPHMIPAATTKTVLRQYPEGDQWVTAWSDGTFTKEPLASAPRSETDAWSEKHGAASVAEGVTRTQAAIEAGRQTLDIGPYAEARDKRSLSKEPRDVQETYYAVHGTNAASQWVKDHNATLPPTETTITPATEQAPPPGGETAEQRAARLKREAEEAERIRRENELAKARAASGGPPVVDAPVHTGSPTPYAPSSVGGQEQEAFNAAIEEIATKLATTEDELRKTEAVRVGLEQARIDTEQQQAAAAQQLQAIDILSDPRASFFEQFSRAPRGTPIQIGPELSAVMRGQTIPSYGEIRHYTPGRPQLETIVNDPESIRRAFEGAVGRLTAESIQNLSPRATDQLSVLGQIGGYFPTDVFRAREAAIPKQPRLVRSLQLG